MIRRKVIVETERGNRTTVENMQIQSDIIEWLEKHEYSIPYFGDFKDKLTIIYDFGDFKDKLTMIYEGDEE